MREKSPMDGESVFHPLSGPRGGPGKKENQTGERGKNRRQVKLSESKKKI